MDTHSLQLSSSEVEHFSGFSPAPHSELPPFQEIEQEAAPYFEKVKRVVSETDWAFFAPYVVEINRLKREKNAVILAHNYMTPEIFHCVADVVGDSLQLAIEAGKTDAEVIVQCGVHFMAETSKILNPHKTVLLPDIKAGCSLAASITGEDVRALKARYPDVPVVTYVNTSAEVKAESDICCTSSNVVKIVESLGVPRVLCIPDEYLAKYVQTQTSVEILTWRGHCEVHERFSSEDLQAFKAMDPHLKIVAHPECPPDVIDVADFTGSTAKMIDYVKKNSFEKVLLVTECSMADNVAAEAPQTEFVRPCNLCPHMKRITLPKIYTALKTHSHEITVPLDIAERARRAVERMIAAS